METLISEIMKIEVISMRDASFCAQIYLHMTKVKKYWNVSFKYSNDLQKMYIEGRKTKHDQLSAFVPLDHALKLSFSEIQSYFQLIKDPIARVYLVFCTRDCVNVYYEVRPGIQASAPKNKQAKAMRRIRETILRKNINLLKTAATHGISVNLNMKQ